MKPTWEEQFAAMGRMTPTELQERYVEVFGERPRSRNRQWLFKRIAWRLQALSEGDLSERTRRRAMELANDADLRTTAPKDTKIRVAMPVVRADGRLPVPGAMLTREYQGRTVEVLVLPKGFEFEGRVYRSLSAVAKAITGSHWNGYHFFGLKGERAAS